MPSVTASSPSSSSLRIIDGTEANELRYPYVVSISQYPDNPHFCGGSFIAPDVILSAAHCNCFLIHGDSSSCDISVGRNNISSPFYGNGEVIFFEKEIIHPNFDPTVLLPESDVDVDYDFNLIFLQNTITDITVFSNLLYLRIKTTLPFHNRGRNSQLWVGVIPFKILLSMLHRLSFWKRQNMP